LALWELIQLTLMFLTVALAILAVELSNLIYAVIALCGMYVTIGLLYWTLHAPYVALFQFVVYAGAVIVLFLVVVALAGGEAQVEG